MQDIRWRALTELSLTELQAEHDGLAAQLVHEQQTLADLRALGGGWAVERQAEWRATVAARVEALKAAIAAHSEGSKG